MDTLLNTEMMNLMSRVDMGTVKTSAQFDSALVGMADNYGSEVTAESYLEMLRHCSPRAQEKISRLAGR